MGWALGVIVPDAPGPAVLSGQGASHQPIGQPVSTFLGVSFHRPQRHFGSPIGYANAFGRVDLYRPLGNSCWFLVAVGAAGLSVYAQRISGAMNNRSFSSKGVLMARLDCATLFSEIISSPWHI